MRAEPGANLRGWLLAVVPMLLVLGAGLAGAASSALRSEPGLSPRAVIVAVSSEVAIAHDPDGSRAVELPWLLPGDRDVAISPDGRRLAFVSERDGNAELYVVDTAAGTPRRLTFDRRASDTGPSWSPGGRLLAWESSRGETSVIRVARADGSGARVVAEGGRNTDPDWAPTGRRLVFSSDRDGSPGLWLASVSSGSVELLTPLPAVAHEPDWSPAGDVIVFDSGGDLWQVDVARQRSVLVVGGAAWDTDADWSPSGDRLAFTRSSYGRRSLRIAAADGTGARALEGAANELGPVWATVSPTLAPPPDALLPDLDQRPPTELTVLGAGRRWSLGFTSIVENLGEGAVVIRGTRKPGAATMRADQLIEFRGRARLVVPHVGRLRFEPHAPHHHWHLQPFETYELRKVSQPTLVVRDRKSGFCLVDRYGSASLTAARLTPPRFTGNCAAGQPDALHVIQGSSPGFRDRYPAFFHGQDVDVTALPPGLYTLVHHVNPLRLLREQRYTNNLASALLRLTWPRGRDKRPAVAVVRSCETAESCGVTASVQR